MQEPPEPPTAAEIAEITKLIESANNVGSQAVAFSAERLRVCVAVGERLLEWKKQLGHGNWEQFTSEHWPELPESTRQRWIRLAQAKASGRLNLDSARGLRHAYVLAGILPDTGEGTNAKSTASTVSYLVHIARLVAALQHINLSALSPHYRSTLRERLQPVITLAAKLES